MNNIKKVALTALTALAATTAPAQAGYMVDGYHVLDANDFNAPQGRIVKALEKLGVPVIDGAGLDHCEPREDGAYRLGFYVPSHNVMVLCTNNGDASQMHQTLTHESVHVLQDIRAGFYNDDIKTNDREISYFAQHLPQDQVDLIVNLYEKDQWAAEIEARVFQDNPSVVADRLEDEVYSKSMGYGNWPTPETFRF